MDPPFARIQKNQKALFAFLFAKRRQEGDVGSLVLDQVIPNSNQN
jgi:hypothetical protein